MRHATLIEGVFAQQESASSASSVWQIAQFFLKTDRYHSRHRTRGDQRLSGDRTLLAARHRTGVGTEHLEIRHLRVGDQAARLFSRRPCQDRHLDLDLCAGSSAD